MKSVLQGTAAFDALRHIATGEPHSAFSCADPPLERLRSALAAEGRLRSALDTAVLIRHALMYENARRNAPDCPARLRLRKDGGSPGDREWARVGMRYYDAGSHWEVMASGWRPTWLTDSAVQAADWNAAGEALRRPAQPARRTGRDPFLVQVGCDEYRGPGQRVAVRAALSMPTGATLVVVLPTGEGKSLVFRLIDAVGFAEPSHGPGVTVVVVPTVTLALDQERAANGSGGPVRAYVGGDEARARALWDGIAAGTQGLCFASPEAVCGPLRAALRKAAQEGHLRALVIDEAHLVLAPKSSGHVRPDFVRVLTGIRRPLPRPQPRGAGERPRPSV
jgi:ATP-dependent DNA helicase RecQ